MDNTPMIDKELLKFNGWNIHEEGMEWWADIEKLGCYAEYRGNSKILNIWKEKPDDAYNPDVHIRTADRLWKFYQAFRLAGINFHMTTKKQAERIDERVKKWFTDDNTRKS